MHKGANREKRVTPSRPSRDNGAGLPLLSCFVGWSLVGSPPGSARAGFVVVPDV